MDNKMAFFSGTDINTLATEGNDTVHFVSLIVNNAGIYTAGITRKIIRKGIAHTIMNLDYDTFDNKKKHIKTITEDKEVTFENIEWFKLNIIKKECDKFKELDERLLKIKNDKQSKYSYTNHYSFDNSNHKEIPLINNASKDVPTFVKTPDKNKISITYPEIKEDTEPSKEEIDAYETAVEDIIYSITGNDTMMFDKQIECLDDLALIDTKVSKISDITAMLNTDIKNSVNKSYENYMKCYSKDDINCYNNFIDNIIDIFQDYFTEDNTNIVVTIIINVLNSLYK